MPDFSFLEDVFQQKQSMGDCQLPEHQAKLTHEVLGGGVAYEACKAFEDHRAANGEPDSHAKAKEIMAGLVGAIVDREFETKGLDWLDREEVKRHATEQAHAALTPDDYQT